jgi:hypothetical protein
VISLRPPGLQREQRRRVLMESPRLKGLDSVAVEAVPVGIQEGQLWRLRLRFVPAAMGVGKRLIPEGLAPANIRILLDGVPDPHVEVRQVLPGADEGVASVLVRTDQQETQTQDPPGHLLELVGLDDVDPLFSTAPLTFRLDESEARLVPIEYREVEVRQRTEIDYLARDYDSFRQLLLERMAFYVPDWEERNPSDLGVTLIEVLAYAADYLSYYQDAVATEAYLGTARRRISVRRHTRLLDYRLHEGTNARVWAQISIASQGAWEAGLRLAAGTRLLTASQRLPGLIEDGSRDYRRALEEGALVFQTLHPAVLYPEHEEMLIYTWGAEDFVLPRGGTKAALQGHLPRLRAGEVLVLEKREGYDLNEGSTPDPRERQAVRLSRPPVLSHDSLTGADITEIGWHEADALEVDFPVARVAGRVRQERLSLARGNVVLADHGRTFEDLLEPVPATGDYRPILPRTGLTFRQPFDAARAAAEPAAWAVQQVREQALPDIELIELPVYAATPDGEETFELRPVWRPQYDLLGSARFARDFVVEIDEGDAAHLRFGDGEAGRRPPAGARFLARYRVGNGPHGNIGAHALQHVVLTARERESLAGARTAVVGVRNHLAGLGGTHPKPAEHAQVYAPEDIHSLAAQRRCVTEEDFAEMAGRHPEVRRAVARRQWTGGSTAVVLYVQRKGGLRSDPELEGRLRRFLQPALMAGFDLVLREPLYVPVEIELTVFTEKGVREEMLYARLFGSDGGGQGQLFDPDQFSFGRGLYLSRLTALVMRIPGVSDLRVDVFKRWGQPPAGELEAGYLAVGPFEIVRLDNDPAAPQLGSLRLRVEERR